MFFIFLMGFLFNDVILTQIEKERDESVQLCFFLFFLFL